jgi:hypothetical protein
MADRPDINEAPREWLSINDPDEERTWVFDVSFLTSRWTCIFGRGCPGVEDEPDVEASIGCCSHGAFVGDDEDEALVRRRIDMLTADDWYYRDVAPTADDALFVDDEGNLRTKVVDGACIMLNRNEPGWTAGCALHQVAVERGESIHDWKPSVCWQAPLRREDLVDTNGHVYSTIRDWKRRDWGEGGFDFGWWCVEEPEAFVGDDAVYISCEEDLRALTNDVVYDELCRLLDSRKKPTWLPLPVRRKTPS